MKRQEIVLKAIQPSAAVHEWYLAKLRELIEDMGRSMLLHVRAAWKRNTPIGFDEAPTKTLERSLKRWGDQWQSKLDALAPEIAKLFANLSRRDFDRRMARMLKKSGFTVRFAPTKYMREAYRAVVQENVNLIRSIPQKYLTDVRSSVWTHVMKGGDMAGLEKAIKHTYGVTWRRAALISRDQNHKARAVFESARRSELGITQAIWRHSGAGKEPRPEHVRWGRERKRFDVKKGLYSQVDGEWVLPGTAINCRCTSSSVFTP